MNFEQIAALRAAVNYFHQRNPRNAAVDAAVPCFVIYYHFCFQSCPYNSSARSSPLAKGDFPPRRIRPAEGGCPAASRRRQLAAASGLAKPTGANAAMRPSGSDCCGWSKRVVSLFGSNEVIGYKTIEER